MMRKKRIILVSVLLSCLVAPLVLSCLAGPAMAERTQTEKIFYEEIEAYKERAIFFVAYDKKSGQPIEVIAAPNTIILMEGDNLSTDFATVLKQIEARDKGEKIVDTTCETSFYVHGSPGCRIKKLASGGYKVICD